MLVSVSGAQGTGKTTTVFELAKELKIKHPDKTVVTLNELAVSCPFPVNKSTTEESQLWIFTNQIKSELKLSLISDIVVADRTIVDGIAYTIAAGYTNLADGMIELSKHYINKYDKIYYKLIKNNSYNYRDGFRDNDEIFRKTVEEIMLKLYNEVFMVESKLVYC